MYYYIVFHIDSFGAFTANTWLNKLKSTCNGGKSGVGAARSCVNSMSSGILKTSLGNKLEDFGGAIEPSFSDAVTG